MNTCPMLGQAIMTETRHVSHTDGTGMDKRQTLDFNVE